MSQQSLASLGISPLVLSKLLDADFTTVGDIKVVQLSELSEATTIPIEQCAEIFKLIDSKNNILHVKSARDIINEENSQHILTFCKMLDNILGGGISLECITEIVGTPGVGKTQLCLQLCISVQTPEEIGGLESEALFIDTEGSFSANRLKEMSTFTVNHMMSVYNLKNYSVESILKGVHHVRCHSYLEMLAVVKTLPTIIAERPKVKLIVIDSIAFHIRQEIKEPTSRTSILCALTQMLIQQAKQFKLAVVVTNQMTTKLKGGTGFLVPALGEVWAHCPTIRLLLSWESGVRLAKLLKSPHLPEGSAQYQVTAGGIRDCATTGSRKRKFENICE